MYIRITIYISIYIYVYLYEISGDYVASIIGLSVSALRDFRPWIRDPRRSRCQVGLQDQLLNIVVEKDPAVTSGFGISYHWVPKP